MPAAGANHSQPSLATTCSYCFQPCTLLTAGQRHAFLCHYRVGFNQDGRVTAYDAKLYNNAGNSWVSPESD